MKLRVAILITALVALMAAPSVASAACPVGISNELSVVPPATLAEGQTQRHSYRVTACTQVQKVTVEWVRVKQSNRPWLYDATNRETIIAETSQGTAMSGQTSWTIPAGTPDGHYAVITRYYAVGYTTPEDQAGSSFSIVTPDVCANIAGKQQTVPAGLVSDGAGNCVTDECPNLDGIQQTVPAGLVKDGAGNCVTDECPNLSGVQTSVPAGLVKDSSGNCVTDECPNITGIQTSVPAGLVKDNGSCVTDVCQNIDGVQTSVPAGLILTGAGECIVPPQIISDPVDVCPNIDGLQVSVPDGYQLVAGECKIIAKPTGEDPKPLAPSPWIRKVANRSLVTTGQNVTFTIRLGNRGPGTLRSARMCDRLPAGTIYVSHTGSGAFTNGSICWNLGDLRSGATRTFKVTLRVSPSFHGRTLTNTACMSAAHAKKVCSTVRVKVKVKRQEPVGGVTG
jgi:uncharacterized repeat protein (TIGR01451 family)